MFKWGLEPCAVIKCNQSRPVVDFIHPSDSGIERTVLDVYWILRFNQLLPLACCCRWTDPMCGTQKKSPICIPWISSVLVQREREWQARREKGPGVFVLSTFVNYRWRRRSVPSAFLGMFRILQFNPCSTFWRKSPSASRHLALISRYTQWLALEQSTIIISKVRVQLNLWIPLYYFLMCLNLSFFNYLAWVTWSDHTFPLYQITKGRHINHNRVHFQGHNNNSTMGCRRGDHSVQHSDPF